MALNLISSCSLLYLGFDNWMRVATMQRACEDRRELGKLGLEL